MRPRWLVLALSALALVHALSFLGAGPHDDDFIVYRYARNLALGHGLVFQPGERVEGFTTPLWTLLCAGMQRAGLALPRVVPWIGALAAAAATWAVGDAWRRRFPEDRWPLPALVLAALPALAWHAVVGLGTTLLAAALAFWLRALEREARGEGSAWATAGWLALACGLRQECLLFVLPYAASGLGRAGARARVAAALLPLAVLAAWTGFRLLYYGRWVPISYSVKKLPPAADLEYGLAYLGRSTLECGVALALVLAAGLPRAARALRPALAGLLLHTLYVVWVGGDYMPLARFFVPTLPLLAYLAAVSVRSLAWARSANARVACAIVLLALQWPQRERPQLFGEQRFFVERWAALGRHFGRVLPRTARVALSPIGAFGYESDLALVDILGLTNERVLAAAPDLSIAMKGHHRYDADYVLGLRPEVVILFNGVRQPDTGRWEVNPWERTLYTDPRFAAEYQAVWTEVEGSSDPLLYFLRRDQPFPPGTRLPPR